jgi:hypothetical protein
MTNEELQALIASNAKSIEALTHQIAETDAISRRHSGEISDLRSTVSTLADIVAANHEESTRRHEESERRAEADRALMLQLIQAIAQGRNGG